VQRYFTDKKQDGKFILTDSDSYHIAKVMRMRVGDVVEVVYENRLFHAKILSFNPVCLESIEEVMDDSSLSISVYLVQSAVKEQKMDYILQKATELGVAGIYPYQAERSVVKLTEKWDKKKTRWEMIVKEASEQSKRTNIPEVFDVLNLKDFQNLGDFDLKILCTVNEKQESLKKVLSNLKKGGTMVVIVGPEGGFTDKEEEELMRLGFVPTSLGKTVLRTETASSFILSAVRFMDME